MLVGTLDRVIEPVSRLVSPGNGLTQHRLIGFDFGSSQQLRDAVAALYDAWWDKRAPARTRFERAAATVARKRAMAGDWCAAAALDDDWLDMPCYQPEYGWKAATGTGAAPDIHPSALPQQKERPMADDQRLTWGFILEVFDVLERHGYRRSDSEHAGQAIGLIRQVARIYEGTLDAPVGGYVVVPSSPSAGPQQPAPPGRDAVIVSAGRGQDSAGRAGRSRRIQAGPSRDVRRLHRPGLHHLPVALASRRYLRPDSRPMIHATEASAARQHAPGHSAPPSVGPHAAAGKEAGQ